VTESRDADFRVSGTPLPINQRLFSYKVIFSRSTVGTYEAEAWSFGKWKQQRLLSFENELYACDVCRGAWTAKRRNKDILQQEEDNHGTYL